MNIDILRALGPIWGASGVQGFFGEGYWYHKYLRFIGLLFPSMAFVAKTTTLNPRLNPENKQGNMPLGPDGITPLEKFPKCIHISPRMWWNGMVLNAVGLSGPGALALLDAKRWQKRTHPFVISFMSVAPTKKERLEELQSFVDLLICRMAAVPFKTDFVLQLNYSCPNVGHHVAELIGEIEEGLEIASILGVPLMPKFNVEIPVLEAKRIAANPHCAGICISNTLPFGSSLLPKEWWVKHFDTADPKQSPLGQFGGGGLSGKPLFPLVVNWIREARKAGITTYINGGGGILGPLGVIRTMLAGANSVFIGSAPMLRPWMTLPSIITAHVFDFFRTLLA